MRLEFARHRTPGHAAFSLSIGVFFGFFPIYGFQVIALMALSFALRINRPLALLGVYVSNPPTYPFIIALAVWVGKKVVPHSWIIGAAHLPFRFNNLLAHGIEWFFGSLVLSLVLGGLCCLISYLFFLALARRKNILVPDAAR
ncbi:MAG: DUF2062 domain-containing protein [Chitinivibrionales bacterium]|nr:DUF2062 domain-containing protein [Chitinivibrionales bacterium]